MFGNQTTDKIDQFFSERLQLEDRTEIQNEKKLTQLHPPTQLSTLIIVLSTASMLAFFVWSFSSL